LSKTVKYVEFNINQFKKTEEVDLIKINFSTLRLYESYYETCFACCNRQLDISVLKQTSAIYFFKVGIYDLGMTKMKCQNKCQNKRNFSLSCFRGKYINTSFSNLFFLTYSTSYIELVRFIVICYQGREIVF
jgi:hypothetical protein